jgi:hypothetical protein
MQLLELGSLKTLCEVFFSETDTDSTSLSHNIRAKIMQAASANVRSHPQAEEVFCHLPQSRAWLEAGLQLSEPIVLRQRTLFFLRALITSDTTSFVRLQTFEPCISYVLQEYLLRSSDMELQEMTLEMVNQMLEQALGESIILRYKEQLSTLAATSLRDLDVDQETAMEREEWERLVRNLNNDRIRTDSSLIDQETSRPILMIENQTHLLPQ